MLEGKEVEGDFAGGAGKYNVDVKSDGTVDLEISFERPLSKGFSAKSATTVKADIIELLEAAALKTDNKIDDKIISLVKQAFGRE